MYQKILFLLLLSLNCVAQRQVNANDPLINYNGRVQINSGAVRLEWPGTTVRIRFKGTAISTDLQDEHAKNRFNVIIDGKVTSILSPDSTRRTYLLAEGLPEGTHTVELFKRTEAGMGGTMFYQFLLNANANVVRIPQRKRRIEFYGNSITCGMAIGDTLKDGVDENNYLAYGAVVARSLDADYYCIAKSGIGLMVSWFPEIMPEVFDRVYESDAKSKWDFEQYQPQVVVADLGQNDSWIVNQPENAQFKRRFGNSAPTNATIINAYKQFFTQLRKRYPKARIICTLGSMDATKQGSPWPGYVKSAVNELHDQLMDTLIFPFDPPVNKKDSHPGFKEHQKMADMLTAFIHSKVGW